MIVGPRASTANLPNLLDPGEAGPRGMAREVARSMTIQEDLTAHCSLDAMGETLSINLGDRRAGPLALFIPLSDLERHALVADAWRVGLSAVMGAYRHAEESRLSDLGRELRENIDVQCRSFVERQEHTLQQVLARYFDPRDGQVMERLQEFLRDGGMLARTMDQYLAPERGMLAVTLSREVGQSSPLLQALSPTASEGFLHALELRVGQVLQAQQVELTNALDPLAENGAIARFMRSLREELETANMDREKLLQTATAALDANNPSSAICRLMAETSAAKDSLAKAMNPDVQGSPLAVLKTTLAGMIQVSAKAHQEALASFEAKQLKSSQEIRDIVTRLEERRRNEARSTHGGFNFQDSVVEFVTGAMRNAPVMVDVTATATGNIAACKVGDLVLELTADSSCPGTRVVVEAKREHGFSTAKALKELETARSNRSAAVGILVIAKSHVPQGSSPLTRHGRDIIVAWDDNDEATDPYLHAALLLGLAIASRSHKTGDDGDIKALSNIEGMIQKELERFERMRKLSERIESDARELQDEVRKSGGKMESMLKKAKSTLRALNVELEAEDVVLALPGDSLENARLAVRAEALPPVSLGEVG